MLIDVTYGVSNSSIIVQSIEQSLISLRVTGESSDAGIYLTRLDGILEQHLHDRVFNDTQWEQYVLEPIKINELSPITWSIKNTDPLSGRSRISNTNLIVLEVGDLLTPIEFQDLCDQMMQAIARIEYLLKTY